jgi:hypothetical protein
MNINKLLRILVYLILVSNSATFFLSCKKDQEKLLTPVTDVSGKWIIIEKIDENCSDISVPKFATETVEVQQNNNELSINFVDRNSEVKGQISGDKISCNTSIPYNKATVSVDFNGTLQSDLISLKGNASWNLSANGYSCKGTVEITAMKLLTPTADASGYWTGTWTTENGSGNFTFQIKQNNDTLSGTVPIPGITIPEPLKGVITGNTIIFGNGYYDYRVFFTGNVTGSNASGTYYDINYDKTVVGSWQATRNLNVSIGKAEIADSINYLFPIKKYTSVGGLVVNSSTIFIANGDYIYKYDRIHSNVDSILSPGNTLAYDGNDLITTRGASIYKFSPDGKSIIIAPVEPYRLHGLTFDGKYFWVKDYQQGQSTDIKIHQFNSSGQIIKTLPCADYSENYGLASDGKYLWYTSYNRIIKSDLDGNIISTHSNPDFFSISGIASDGTNLWFGSYAENKIWKTDTAGTILNTILAPDDYAMGLVYDKSNLWYLYGSSGNEKLAKLGANGNIVFQTDVSLFRPTGLAFDGQYLWLADYDNMHIYRLNTDLSNYVIINSVYPNYLTYDNGHYWAINGNLPNIKISEIDGEGNVLSSFDPPQSAWGDIESDGTNLWISGSDKIYKVNKQGDILAIYYGDSRISEIQAMSYDGQNLWCYVADKTNKFYKLKFAEK